jgi:hypothetical protein
MKLTNEQINKLNLLTEQGVYDCCLVQQRFAFKLFHNNISPLGDIALLRTPTKVGPLILQDALVAAIELPNCNMFGGVCFARLYAAQLGSCLSALTSKSCVIDESCIFVEDKQTSLSMINQIKDSILIHFIFPLVEGNTEKMFGTFEFNEENIKDFEITLVESFKQLTKNIFIESRRDNF